MPPLLQSAMILRTFLFLSCAIFAASAQYKSSLDYLSEMGLEGEEHEVTTDDGYILTMFRIPREGATPVIAMHGLLGTSDSWLLMGRRYNLATILADRGFDVWILNQRGNAYSHRHTRLPTGPADFDYWDFSVEEIGVKDLPATIDYVLSVTRRRKLLYIGHSMGCMLLFMLCARLPEYCMKIDAAVLLAPAIHPPQRIGLPSINLLIQLSPKIAESMRTARIYEFLGRKQFAVDFTHNSCLYEGIVCRLTLQALDFRKNNGTLQHPIADYFAATVGGTSVKVYEHLSYMISKSGHFGPLKPHSFGLSNILTPHTDPESYEVDIQLPVGIIWAADDIFIDDAAITRLKPRLKNLVLSQKVPSPFKHLGFFYELKNNYDIVNNILEVFRKHDSTHRPSAGDTSSTPRFSPFYV